MGIPPARGSRHAYPSMRALARAPSEPCQRLRLVRHTRDRLGLDLASNSFGKRATPAASSVLTRITPQMSRTWGISSVSPLLRTTCPSPWLDVRGPTRRFTSSLARSASRPPGLPYPRHVHIV